MATILFRLRSILPGAVMKKLTPPMAITATIAASAVNIHFFTPSPFNSCAVGRPDTDTACVTTSAGFAAPAQCLMIAR
jgi:hypothetical protein